MKTIFKIMIISALCASIYGCKSMSSRTEASDLSSSTVITKAPIEYKIEAGDSLAKISKKFNVGVNEIVAANNIQDKNKIKVGQVLTIPQ